MVGFFTPYSSTGENTEKVSLGVTALLSLAIILLMVADKMPATSKVIPLIGKYYIGLIWLIFAATIVTTVTLRVQSKGNAGRPLNERTKRFMFDYVARILLMRVDLPTNIKEQRDQHSQRYKQSSACK
uniref:Neurotransmitter-gated ion-channel transmembrane domain-containing protein n=1 Tax=Plectus sambesii TaxID=2011161 RepID=A0A914V7L4_9BILA